LNTLLKFPSPKQRHQLVMLLKRFDCAILNTLANVQGLGFWGKHDLGKRTHSSFRLEAPGISTSHDNESNEIIFCNPWKVKQNKLRQYLKNVLNGEKHRRHSGENNQRSST
jgi:hypothetical protein